MASEKDPQSSGPKVIIIGGGIGGILTAISLKKRLGFDNHAIYEQADDLGGTWNWNTYPGCASDVGTHWYSLSSDLNPNWDRTHVYQPELKAYWKRLSVKYGVDSNVRFHTKVVGADWDSRHQLYHVELLDLPSGRKWTEVANAIVSAAGILDVPYFPEELKGIRDTFRGQHFHSARWDYNVDLRNKRVAVIGNGCSAAQFVPIIAEDPTTQILSFARTPNWTLPRSQQPIPVMKRRIFKYVPFVMRLHRWLVSIQSEMNYFNFMSGGLKNKRRDDFTQVLLQYMKDTAPKEYHERLTPKYPLGCKRFIVDCGWLESLHKPNNDITFDGIAEVTETGILTKQGQHHEFDVIIEATGFVVDDYPIVIRGSDGITIQQYYREHSGPTAYIGTTIPGFPNFFTVHGPNMGTGHGSVIFTEEAQMTYIVKMLDPIVKGFASSFEVTHEATDAWNERIQRKLSSSVWSACHSWYRVGHTGKNSALWPGPLIEQWWLLRSPEWSHYKAVGAEKWKTRQILKRVWRTVEIGSIVVMATWAYLHTEDVLRIASQSKDLVHTVLGAYQQ